MSRHDQMTAGRAALPAPIDGAGGGNTLATQGASRPADIESSLAGQIQDLLAAGNDHGAREVFGQIVSRQQRRASRIAWHYLRDVAEADEAVQDAFVKAYTHIKSFQRNL
jgi:Sigma-70 region 2